MPLHCSAYAARRLERQRQGMGWGGVKRSRVDGQQEGERERTEGDCERKKASQPDAPTESNPSCARRFE
eukprot:6193089-Pleurochrysis_carterae.AAC.3